MGCAFTEYSNSAWMLVICRLTLLKKSASRQEKASGCNRNGAPSDAHIHNVVVVERGLNVDTAWSEHFDALLEDDGPVADCERMAYKVSDGAARGGTCGGVFSVVELHARVPIRT